LGKEHDWGEGKGLMNYEGMMNYKVLTNYEGLMNYEGREIRIMNDGWMRTCIYSVTKHLGMILYLKNGLELE